MGYIGKPEIHNGFTVRFWRNAWGMYDIEITKYKNKGTRREMYISEKIPTYEKTKKDAKKFIKIFINKLKKEFKSQGLTNAMYLPE